MPAIRKQNSELKIGGVAWRKRVISGELVPYFTSPIYYVPEGGRFKFLNRNSRRLRNILNNDSFVQYGNTAKIIKRVDMFTSFNCRFDITNVEGKPFYRPGMGDNVFLYDDEFEHLNNLTPGMIKKKVDEMIRKKLIELNVVHYAIYTLRENSIRITTISKVDAYRMNMIDVPMRELVFNHSNLNQDFVDTGKGQCVIDAILYTLQGRRGFKKLSRQSLISFFPEYQDGISSKQLVEWAKSPQGGKNNVNVYGYNIANKQFISYNPPHRADCSIVYKINGNHMYLITDTSMKKSCIASKQLHKLDVDMTIIPGEYITIDLDTTRDIYEIIDNNENTTILLYHSNEEYDEQIDLMLSVMTHVTKNKKMYIDSIKTDGNGRPIGFIHPISNNTIIYKPALLSTETLLTTIKSLVTIENINVPSFDLEYRGQSASTIAKTIMSSQIGNIKKSMYSSYLRDLFDSYPLNPMYYSQPSIRYDNSPENPNLFVRTDNYEGRHMVLDIRHCYRNAMYNPRGDSFPIFNQFCHPEVYTLNTHGTDFVGEFIINKTIETCIPGFVFNQKLYPGNLVRYFVENGYITTDDIEYIIQPVKIINGDVFRPFIEFMNTPELKDYSKELVNHMIGLYGKKYTTNYEGIMTDSNEIAQTMWFEYGKNGKKMNCFEMNDMFYLRSCNKTRNTSDSVPINRHILAGGIIQTMELCKYISGKGLDIVGIKTDCVQFVPSCEDDVYENYIEIKDSYTMGEYKPEIYKKIEPFQQREREDISTPPQVESHEIDSVLPDNLDKSCLIQGIAGCGKTYLLCQIVKELRKTDKKFQVLSYTHDSVRNLNNRDSEMNARTINSFASDRDSLEEFGLSPVNIAKLDVVLIDEIFTPGSELIGNIGLAKIINPKLVVFGFGDTNQTVPVEDSKNTNTYNYTQSYFFMNEIFQSRSLTLEYRTDCGRYNQEALDIVDEFSAHGEITTYEFNPVDDDLTINICKLNSTKCRVDKYHMMKQAEGMTNTLTIKNDKPKKSQLPEVILYEGMEVMSNVNRCFKCSEEKSIPICNRQRLTIDNWDDDNIYMNVDEDTRVTVPIKYFNNSFELCFCTTVYKYQGSSIETDYNILDVKSMTKEEFNTAITRTSPSLSLIHMDYPHGKIFRPHKYRFKTFQFNPTPPKIGNIYKIVNTQTDEFYIGSTMRTIEERFSEHKKDKTCTMMPIIQEGGEENFNISLLYNVSVFSESQLKRYEHSEINRFISKGFNLYNELKKTKTKDIYENTNVQKTFIECKYSPRITEKSGDRLVLTYYIKGKRTLVDKKYKRLGREVVYKQLEKMMEKIKRQHY